VNEFCNAGSCRQQIDSAHGVFSEDKVATICFAVLSALAALSARNRTHGCVSASSIMLINSASRKDQCRAKLRDKRLTNLVMDWRLGQSAVQARRIYWRAPEPHASSKLDIWSLGITCLELVEGRPPHWNLPPARVRQQVVNSPPPSLLHPNQHSDTFRRFIEQCLTKDPARRPDAKTLLQVRNAFHSILITNGLTWFILNSTHF